MCNAVGWTNHVIRFAEREAELPVLSRTGSIVMVPWGVPYSEPAHPLPKGPCARLESVKDGRWQRWQPRPVRVCVEKFSERSPLDRCNYWFAIPPNFAIQGLFIPPSDPKQRGRVYVVTVPLETARSYGLKELFALPAGGIDMVHDRWPRLVPLGDTVMKPAPANPFQPLATST